MPGQRSGGRRSSYVFTNLDARQYNRVPQPVCEINQARDWRGDTLALRDFSLSLVHSESVARVRPASRFHRRASAPDRGAFFIHRANTHFHCGASRCDREAIEIHRFQIKPDRGMTNFHREARFPGRENPRFHRDALFFHGFTLIPDRGALILHREGLFSRKSTPEPRRFPEFPPA